jgi:hypothetical protein
MTTTTSPAPVHPVAVISDGDEYRAECACGWASGWHFTPDVADEEGGWHRDDAARAADAMDQLMSDLLDLQDDLAAVVVWLAENWSTGLPSLGWSAAGDDRDRDRPALRVLGHATPAEMTAVAVVLDIATADDPPNACGNPRYRHAIRDFGRVRLDVFADLPTPEPETAP